MKKAEHKVSPEPAAKAPTSFPNGDTKASKDNGASRNWNASLAPAPNGSANQAHPVKPAYPDIRYNPNGIPDWRLEHPNFHTEEAEKDGKLHYILKGDWDKPAPPLRESKYLTKDQSLAIYRFMVLNRKMEQTLENLFKQQKVVGGVYLGLGQEGCSVAAAYALQKDDWCGPMIRNQGAMLVRGFKPVDTIMQYMAKAGAPTRGRDAGAHYGDVREKNILAPISHLGDSIPALAGVALGARLQGRNIACLTFVGDGGQSTGPTYEGFNFAAVQRLGVVLIVEHNLWAYSTPVELQFSCKDLADRSIGYGVPGVIIDGTDPNQVYDATYEACQRAYRGEGATLIEAKMMRMRGHAMHDAAAYVPKEYFEYWRRRDCLDRMEKYLLDRAWLTRERNEALLAEVQSEIDRDREIADACAFPGPEVALGGVYPDNSTRIPFKYGGPSVREIQKGQKAGTSKEAAHFK